MNFPALYNKISKENFLLSLEISLKLYCIFILIFTPSLYSEEYFPKIINLLYHNEAVDIDKYNNLNIPNSNKETFNRFYSNKGKKDSRFLNSNSRENGIDISKKILFLKSNGEITFTLKFNLNHKLHYNLKNPENISIFLNDTLLNKKILQSNKPVNTLRIHSKSEVGIHSLFLEDLTVQKEMTELLFLVIDSLRADVVGFQGGKYGVTPNLDDFAENKIRFLSHSVNSSWTRPSTLIFFTGLYPSKSYINFWDYPVFQNEREEFYTSKIQPLPALLARNGYRTVLIGNNPFFTDHRYIGVDVGFEEVYEFSLVDRDTEKITKKYISFLNEKKSDPRPVFVFLNYNDPHKPYEPPQIFRNMVKNEYSSDPRKKDYLGEVAYVDSEIGTIFSKLKENKSLDNILIIVTSDHGEVMNPYHAKSKFTDVYTLFGHGQGLYEEDIHTPLLMQIPEIKQKLKIENKTRSIDLYPTILDYLHIPIPSDIDGKSLRPVLKSEEEEERVYYGESRGVRGVRFKNWKLMQKTYEFHREGPAWDGRVGREEYYLFDLKVDREENFPVLSGGEEIKSLKTYFSLGNQKRNFYNFRFTNRNSEKRDYRIDMVVPLGTIREYSTEDSNYSPLKSTTVSLKKGEQIEKTFVVIPDSSIPRVTISSDGSRLKMGEYGVGGFDINPGRCELHINECRILFNSTIPPLQPKKDRVQVWITPSGRSLKNEKVQLEKDSIQILKRQGYIQ